MYFQKVRDFIKKQLKHICQFSSKLLKEQEKVNLIYNC